MDDRRTGRVAKFLSRPLRHQPERRGLTLDEAGRVDIDTLIAAAAAHGFPFTRDELDRVIAGNDKRRFAVGGTRIRASQGHSVEVDLGLPRRPRRRTSVTGPSPGTWTPSAPRGCGR